MDLRIVAIVVVVAAAAAVAVASAFCVCHVSQSANNILSNNLGFSYLARDAFDSVMFLLQLCTMFVLSCNLPCNYFIALSLSLLSLSVSSLRKRYGARSHSVFPYLAIERLTHSLREFHLTMSDVSRMYKCKLCQHWNYLICVLHLKPYFCNPFRFKETSTHKSLGTNSANFSDAINIQVS